MSEPRTFNTPEREAAGLPPIDLDKRAEDARHTKAYCERKIEWHRREIVGLEEVIKLADEHIAAAEAERRQ